MNMNNQSCAVCSDGHTCDLKCQCGIRCISWSAIFVGALVAIGLSFLLNMFSVAIGLSAYQMGSDGNVALAMGGLAGLAIGIIAVMFFSGWIAGFLGRGKCFSNNCGGLYGFLTWCFGLLMMVFLSASIGRFVIMVSGFITNPGYMVTSATDMVLTTGNQIVLGADKTAMSVFVLFCLFFIGAIASTLGGRCGMHSCKKADEKCKAR